MDAVRSAPLLLALLLAGCPTTSDPGGVFIPDDDDMGDDDDGADDDDAADDDDGAPTSLTATGILHQTDALGPGGTPAGSEHAAILTFGFGDDAGIAELGTLDGLMLPGLSTHPSFSAQLDTCTEFSSQGSPPENWPASEPVGGVVTLQPSGGGSALEVPQASGLYATEVAGPLESDRWSLVVKGGGDWPPSSLPEVFDLPLPIEAPLPGPGSIGNLSVQFSWTGGSDPFGVEILMFRWTTANQTQWAAVRCIAADDGSLSVPAVSLAAGSGPIVVMLSRGHWETGARDLGGDTLAPHLGAIRTLRYELTPG